MRPLYNFPHSLTKLLALHLTLISLSTTSRAIHGSHFANCSAAAALSCKVHFTSIWPLCHYLMAAQSCTALHASMLFCAVCVYLCSFALSHAHPHAPARGPELLKCETLSAFTAQGECGHINVFHTAVRNMMVDIDFNFM